MTILGAVVCAGCFKNPYTGNTCSDKQEIFSRETYELVDAGKCVDGSYSAAPSVAHLPVTPAVSHTELNCALQVQMPVWQRHSGCRMPPPQVRGESRGRARCRLALVLRLAIPGKVRPQPSASAASDGARQPSSCWIASTA